MAKKQGEEGQAMSEEERLLATALALPLPADWIAGQQDSEIRQSLGIVTQTYDLIDEGFDADDIEALLLAGDDVTAQMVGAAGQILAQQLRQYQKQASAMVSQAQALRRAQLAKLQQLQQQLVDQRDAVLGELDGVIQAYQEQLEKVAGIKGFFSGQFEGAAQAAAGEPAEAEDKKKKKLQLPGALRDRLSGLADRYILESVEEAAPPEEELEAAEVQLVDDVEAFSRLVKPGRTPEQGLRVLKKLNWTAEKMVERVLEAEEVFSAGAAGAKEERKSADESFRTQLRQIEGSVTAAEGALTSLDQKREEITEAVGALEGQIAAVQEMFSA